MVASKKAKGSKKRPPKPRAAVRSRAAGGSKPTELLPAVQPPAATVAAAPPAQTAAPPGMLLVPACQSCGMLMNCEEKFGKNADGSVNRDYCAFCFENGAFRRPDMTLPQMVDRVAGIIVQATGLAQDAARAKAWGFLPQLKRWHP